MTDAKYGRLFTQRDVELIYGLPDALARLVGELEQEGKLTFPADEPLFLLRAQDKAALNTLACYLPEARDADASEDYIAAAGKVYDAFKTWRCEHPDRVKVPD
jgi:hypothetical protein